MTAKEIADRLAAPKAEPLPPRTWDSWHKDWLWHMCAFAPTPELKAYWKRRYEADKGPK